MRSPCCGAPVSVVHAGTPEHGANWYACDKCKQPCDPVEVKAERDDA